jgi:phosphoribosylanthranilate isomerase
MMVKICGITNRDDALAAVDAGASAIGFNFYRESPRYISHTGAAMIAEKVPANVWKVGVFVHETPETIAKIAVDAGLDVAQLHGTSEARGIRRWRACPANGLVCGFSATEEGPGEEAPSQQELPEGEGVEALLIDAPSAVLYGGTGETFDWSLAKRLRPFRVIIAGGLDADNVRLAIEQGQPWGVDACSRIEKSPGMKDHEKMRKFVKAALQS